MAATDMKEFFNRVEQNHLTKIRPINGVEISWDHPEGTSWILDPTLSMVKLINNPAGITAWTIELPPPVDYTLNYVDMVVAMEGFFGGNTITFKSSLHAPYGDPRGSIVNGKENGAGVSFVGPSVEPGVCFFTIRWTDHTYYMVRNHPLVDMTPYELVAGDGIDISGTFPERIFACTHEMVAGELNYNDAAGTNINCLVITDYYDIAIAGDALKTMGTPIFTRQSAGLLLYNSTHGIEQTLHCAGSVSLVGNGANQTIMLQFSRLRGLVETALGDFPNVFSGASDVQTIAFHRLVEVEDGDILKIKVRNSSATGNVLIKAFNLVAVGHYHPPHVM